jgi:hypothetical protein
VTQQRILRGGLVAFVVLQKNKTPVFSLPKRQPGNNFRKTVIPELTGGNTNATMHASDTHSRVETSPQDWKMTMSKFYWLGFEDGFAMGVCREEHLTPQEAFAYRNGFTAGWKASEER